MKKINNISFKILFLLFFIGVFSSYNYGQFLQINENQTYTAANSTNHIWTMTKTAGSYDDISVTVSLDKGVFTSVGGTPFGFGTGVAIPADWDFEIIEVTNKSNQPVGFVGKTFTYPDDPIENVTAKVRVFNTGGTLINEVLLTYHLEGPFTAQNVAFNSCTQSQVITLAELTLPGSGTKPCANYNLKVFNAGTVTLVQDITQTTPTFSLEIPVGNYDYVVTDACGRTINATFSILDIAELGTSVVFNGKECASDANGIAVLRIAGAAKPLTWILTETTGNTQLIDNEDTGSYTVDGDSAAFTTANYTVTIRDLPNGPYNFTFTDNNGCEKEQTFVVNNPGPLAHDLLAKVTNNIALDCFGDVTGSMTFRGTGGWTEPFAGNQFNPTNWGSRYIFKLYNKADLATAILPDTNSVVFSFDGITRNGWEAVFSGLGAGVYQLEMEEIIAVNTDASPNENLGCKILFPEEYPISSPAQIGVDDSIKDDINCGGDVSGTIDLNVKGGTPPYTITWGTLDGSGLDLSLPRDKIKQENLGPGTYNVSIVDSKGCPGGDSFTITEPTEMIVGINTPAAIVCFDDNTGTIIATVDTESVGPYDYVLTGTDYQNNPVAITQNDLGASATFSNLKAGENYKVTITDDNGCIKTTADRDITQPVSGMTFNATPLSDFNGFQISCNGEDDGSIDVTNITGGALPYTYTWTTSNGIGLDLSSTAINIQTELTAGNYRVEVKDNTNICVIARDFTINDPGPLNITTTDMADGFKGNYTFLGENGNSKYYRSNFSRTWLESRDTSSSVKGYLLAIDTLEENQWITTNSATNIWIGYNDIVSEGTFKWINGSSTATFTNWNGSEPNDSNGNEDYTEFLVPSGKWNDLPNLTAKQFVVEYTTNGTVVSSFFGGFNISCNGANDGTITLLPTGGVLKADGTYTYAWTKDGDAAYAAITNPIENLGPGTYNVTVSDRNNCSVIQSFTLTEPPALAGSLDTGVTNVIDCFNDKGTIKVDVNNITTGVGPYTYRFTGTDYTGANVDTSFINQTVLTKSFLVKAGTDYKVKVTDANGCFFETATRIFTQPSAVINVKDIDVKKYEQYQLGDANQVNIKCNGNSDGEITFTVEGGTPNDDGTYNYAWTKDGVSITLTGIGASPQTNLSAGKYKVTITDKTGNCFVAEEFDLKEPDALVINETIPNFNGKQITCFDAKDGSINLNLVTMGGTKFKDDDATNPGTYDFTWVASGGGALLAANLKSQDQTDLGPGDYTVTVKDANGCSVNETYTIEQPLALTIGTVSISDFNGFDVSCSGAVDGRIDVLVNGGIPKADSTYTYAWTGSGTGLQSTNEDQSGLSKGTYELTVTDLNGCTAQATFTIEEPPPIVVSVDKSDFNGFNVKCIGGNEGEIDITPSGGFTTVVNVFTYAWTIVSGGVGATLVANVADQTGLTKGVYRLTITDDNNCSKVIDYEITEPPQIGISGVMSNFNNFQISISGSSDGTITTTPSGGTGLYTYEWTGPNGFTSNLQNQLALSAGAYTVKVIDSNLCNISETFILIEPNELKIGLGTEPTNILCHGASSGLFKAIITSAAVAPYTYTLNGTDYNGATINEVTAPKNDLNHTFNLTAGTYTITVEDLNGATKTSIPRIFTHPAAPLTISETISLFRNDIFNISCNGASDGKIEALATGGTLNGGQYDYTWSTSNGTTIIDPKDKTQSGLGPGEYTLSVKDQNLCITVKTYTLTEPEPIFYSVVSEKDITCFGDNDGAIEISVRKGTGIYTYEWSTIDGSGLTIGETTNPTGLGPGTYKLDLSDGCETLSFVYEIIEPEFLTINIDEKENILCFGEASGKILVTVSGGTAPYNYEWEDNLGNTYNRDIGNVFNKGDLSNIPFGVYDLKVTDFNGCIATEPNVELTQPEDLVVGVVKTDLNCFGLNDGTITVTPNGGVAPYTYEWSDFGNGAIRADLSAGTYTVKVIDKNLCEESVDVIIKQAPLFTIVPVVTPVTCFGAKDGTISLNIDGGESPITVTWADDATAGVNRTNLKPGNYNVVLTDGFGCVIDEVFQIFEPRELTLSAISSDALDCDNPLSGSIDLQVIGGNPPYSILWSTGETSEDIIGLGANNYSVTVTDSKGCRAEKTFVIKRQFEMEVNLDTSLNYVCDSREVYQVNKLTISGGIFPYTVAWSDGDILGNGQSMETKSEGDYQVVVTDGLGCTKTILFNVVLPKLGLPDFDYTSFYLVNFNALTYDDPVTFSNLSTENFQSVEWDFGDGSTSSLNDPTHTYTKAGSYDVTIYVKYSGGCLYSLTKTIFIGDSYELELPNAFTPNSDGLNDTFRPVYYGLTEVNMKVFDTWGTLIYFEKADKNKLFGWNGTINGKLAENGNYIYQVEGKAFNSDLVYKNGPFTLLR